MKRERDAIASPDQRPARAPGRRARLEALLDRGAAEFTAGRLAAARAAYEQALIVSPRDPRVLSSLAMIDIRDGALMKAKDRLAAVVRRDPSLVGAWRNLAAVCQDLDLWAEAAAALERALNLDPAADEVRFALAWALTAIGRVDAAYETYRGLAAAGPWRWQALARIGLLRPGSVTVAESQAMAAAAGDPAVPPQTQIALLFALGASLEARGDIDGAFAAFAEGNRRQRARLDTAAPSDRPAALLAAHQASARQVQAIFTPRFIEAHAEAGLAGPAPIFIVGLPRSGSTLIEQILASHPGIAALGETALLPRCLERLYPADDAGAFATPLATVARDYLATARSRGWTRGRLVDKTLENYLHVGAIALMFPKAVILHAKRDPLDLGLACWRTLFNRGAETLYDLAEIGAEYVAYAQLMDYWRTVLPGRVVEVSLESLTADPPARIRALLAACGLDWNASCLRPWEAAHPVRTASAAQVRGPITAAGIGRWRLYERHLGPLRDVLAAGLRVS